MAPPQGLCLWLSFPQNVLLNSKSLPLLSPNSHHDVTPNSVDHITEVVLANHASLLFFGNTISGHLSGCRLLAHTYNCGIPEEEAGES